MSEEWTKEKENRALRRYRFALTSRIITVAMLLFFCYVIYIIILDISYAQTSKGNKLTAYAQLAIDWTYPGITGSHGFNNADISPILTQSTSVPFYRQIGKDQIDIGEFLVEKPLVTSMTRQQYNFYQQNQQPKFQFYLPIHPESGQILEASHSSGVWETLEKVHEGTVADFAFSTNDYYTPKEMFELLKDYDIEVTWMVLYMGELKTIWDSWVSTENSISVIGPWGLTQGRNFNEQYLNDITYHLVPQNVIKNEQQMLENMKRIYGEDPKLAESIFRTREFKERIQFLEENGFMVYGAVVTGPTKELLRLQELDAIQGAQLGQITYWNWHK